MKISPILFSTPMVQAILEGRKNQTRRKIKPQPVESDYGKVIYDGREMTINSLRNHAKYQVGDILWVRETWGLDYFGSAQFWHLKEKIQIRSKEFLYKASSCDLDVLLEKKWKPSIFMPKAACRIFLEVVKVRVERLQDISEEDAINEGIKVIEPEEAYYDYDGGACGAYAEAKGSFFSLWNKINGKDSWKENPWVWVYEFKQVSKPVNF